MSARPLEIVLLRQGTYPADPRVRREALALRDAGHRVALVCLRGPGEAAEERVEGIDVLRLPLRHRRLGPLRYLWEYGAFFALAARALRRRTRAAETAGRPIDLVQVHSMPDSLVHAARPARRRGARVILDLHEVMPELFASKYGVPLGHPLPRALALAEQAAIRYADAVLAVSRPCLDRYVARGAPADRFTVVMNSPDPRFFHADLRRDLRRDLGPDARPPGPPRLVSHGTLVPRYGFDLLIRALAELPDARLEILGEGEARPDLEALAEAKGVAERVEFAGHLPLESVASRVAGADVGVVANRADAFTALVVPTKLMEYVALRVPAVVARNPAVEAYFAPDELRFATPGDPSALADAIRAQLDAPAEAREMANRAAARFLPRYGWPRMAERYLALVARLGAAARAARSGERP